MGVADELINLKENEAVIDRCQQLTNEWIGPIESDDDRELLAAFSTAVAYKPRELLSLILPVDGTDMFVRNITLAIHAGYHLGRTRGRQEANDE